MPNFHSAAWPFCMRSENLAAKSQPSRAINGLNSTHVEVRYAAIDPLCFPRILSRAR